MPQLFDEGNKNRFEKLRKGGGKGFGRSAGEVASQRLTPPLPLPLSCVRVGERKTLSKGVAAMR